MPEDKKTMTLREIELSLFQTFVVRSLMLIATGLWLLIRKEAGDRKVSMKDAEDYQDDLFNLTEVMKKHLVD